MHATKHMDHGAYQEKVKSMSAAALRYVIQDSGRALAAFPDNPNAGYYQDEICYCADELNRRGQAGFADDANWSQLVRQPLGAVVADHVERAIPGHPTAEARRRVYEALQNPAVQAVIGMAAREIVLD
jgi:hypothetical protein